MKAILISVRPEWAGKSLSGEKTIEVRKSAPHCKLPMRCFLYETKNGGGRGAVVGAYTLNKCGWICPGWEGYDKGEGFLARACLSNEDLAKYSGVNVCGILKSVFGWYISRPETFAKPKPLSDFGLKRPPQSWRYIEV